MKSLFLFIATFIAYFIKGITGFGNTLVMSPLFSFVVSNRITTPIDLVFSIPTNAYIAWKERKNISLKIVFPLSVMLLTGIIPGVFLLKTGNDKILKAALGIVVMGMAVEVFTRKYAKQQKTKTNPIFLIAIGVLSGILAGLYGIGALLVAYINRTTDSKSAFRANICCVFLVDNLTRLFVYIYTGILNVQIILLALILSPAVFLGMFAGMKVYSKMDEDTVKNVVIVLLIVSGTVLFIKNILL